MIISPPDLDLDPTISDEFLSSDRVLGRAPCFVGRGGNMLLMCC